MYAPLIGSQVTVSRHGGSIAVYGILALVNDTIYDWNNSTDNNQLAVELYQDYAFVNVTFMCSTPIDSCRIECKDYVLNNTQYIIIDDSCGSNCFYSYAFNCQNVESFDQIDNESLSMIDTISNILKRFETIYESECNYNFDDMDSTYTYENLLFDIGYPLYGESFIINNYYGGSICCRGDESCAYSRILYSNLGNIICSGEYSCGDAESIWTGDYVNIEELSNANNESL